MTFIDTEVRTLVKCCHIKYSTRVPWGFFWYYEIWRCLKEMFLNPPLCRVVFKQFFTGISSQLGLLLAHHHLPAHVLPPKFICIHLIRLSNCTLLTREYASWRLVSFITSSFITSSHTSDVALGIIHVSTGGCTASAKQRNTPLPKTLLAFWYKHKPRSTNCWRSEWFCCISDFPNLIRFT